MAGARQGQPARVRAPQRGASARFGLPRGFLAVVDGDAEARCGWASGWSVGFLGSGAQGQAWGGVRAGAVMASMIDPG